MKNPFLAHPETVGETYLQHLRHAAGFGFWMAAGALACLVHAILPFLFERTGSRIIGRLHGRMIVNRKSLSAPADSVAGTNEAAA